MKRYIFKTSTTMKPYNNDKYWIMNDVIQEKRIKAGNILEALKQYQTRVKNDDHIIISDTAIKNREPMYYDSKEGETIQDGYVLTALTEFQTDSGKWKKQYIDLWVEILEIDYPNFI